jgi:hypothetical protein
MAVKIKDDESVNPCDEIGVSSDKFVIRMFIIKRCSGFPLSTRTGQPGFETWSSFRTDDDVLFKRWIQMELNPGS